MIKLTDHQAKYINATALKWIEALKSGTYKQSTLKLKSEKGYCCLGVACEIDERVTWKSARRFGTDEAFVYNGSPSAGKLPGGYHGKLGLHSSGGHVEDINASLSSDHHSLVDLNDSGYYNFDRIADIILSQCDKLFVEIAPEGEG